MAGTVVPGVVGVAVPGAVAGAVPGAGVVGDGVPVAGAVPSVVGTGATLTGSVTGGGSGFLKGSSQRWRFWAASVVPISWR